MAAIPKGATIRCRHGIRLRLHQDPAYIWPFLYGEYEEPETQLYSRLIRIGDTVVDAGANVGWYSTLFAKLVGPTGAVHAFEPLPEFAALARDNLALNGVSEITRLNVAGLGSAEGEFTVYTFAGLPLGHASSHDLGRPDSRRHVCCLTTLDAYIEKNAVRQIDFLKIDVEGDERDVLVGGATIIGRCRPFVAFEVNVDCLKPRNILPHNIFDLLTEYGYTSIWEIDKSRLVPVSKLSMHNGSYLAATASRAEQLKT